MSDHNNEIRKMVDEENKATLFLPPGEPPPPERRGFYSLPERKILELTSDNKPHSADEIKECLWDGGEGTVAVRSQLYRLRKKLRAIGQDIVCVYHNKGMYYRRIRLIDTSE